jgi:uncharacterized protein YdbL (DUF1318 family)
MKAAVVLGACLALACTPTMNVATEKPIQIALDVRIRLDEDVKDLLRAEQQGVAPRGLGAAALAPNEASAIAAAKRSRRAGEQRDGYLGAPTPVADTALATALARANEARASAYRALAARHGVAPRAVEQLAGEQRIAQADAGELVQRTDGSWQPQP